MSERARRVADRSAGGQPVGDGLSVIETEEDRDDHQD
jgi:hypothetical protein